MRNNKAKTTQRSLLGGLGMLLLLLVANVMGLVRGARTRAPLPLMPGPGRQPNPTPDRLKLDDELQRATLHQGMARAAGQGELTPLMQAIMGAEKVAGAYLQAQAAKDLEKQNNAVQLAEAVVDDYINAGVDLEAQDNALHYTALHFAAMYNKPKAARALLRAGAKHDALTRAGDTPLHVCAQYNAIATVRVLVKAGAAINAKNKHGETPLHIVAEHATSMASVKQFIELGAALESRTHEDSNTPLMIAASEGNIPAINTLVPHGANVNAVNAQGATALALAAAFSQPHVVKALLDLGADPLPVGSQHSTFSPMLAAVSKPGDDTAVLAALLAVLRNVNTHQKRQAFGLGFMLAWEKKNYNCARLIIRHTTADSLWNVTVDGASPLFPVMLRDSQHAFIPLLVKAGFPLHPRHAGQTPLHAAIANHSTRCVKALLKAGVFVDIPQWSVDADEPTINGLAFKRIGVTPLQQAISFGFEDIVAILIEANAKVRSQADDSNGLSPLANALEGGYPKIARRLLDAGAHSTPADIALAKRKGYTELLKPLHDNMEPADSIAPQPRVPAAVYYTIAAGVVSVAGLLVCGAMLRKQRAALFQALDEQRQLRLQSAAMQRAYCQTLQAQLNIATQMILPQLTWVADQTNASLALTLPYGEMTVDVGRSDLPQTAKHARFSRTLLAEILNQHLPSITRSSRVFDSARGVMTIQLDYASQQSAVPTRGEIKRVSRVIQADCLVRWRQSPRCRRLILDSKIDEVNAASARAIASLTQSDFAQAKQQLFAVGALSETLNRMLSEYSLTWAQVGSDKKLRRMVLPLQQLIQEYAGLEHPSAGKATGFVMPDFDALAQGVMVQVKRLLALRDTSTASLSALGTQLQTAQAATQQLTQATLALKQCAHKVKATCEATLPTFEAEIKTHHYHQQRTLLVQQQAREAQAATAREVAAQQREKERQREARQAQLAQQREQRKQRAAQRKAQAAKARAAQAARQEAQATALALKAERERAARVAMAQGRVNTFAEYYSQAPGPAAIGGAASASASPVASLVPLRGKVISLGDLLSRCRQQTGSDAAIVYKYALLLECLRLFELTRQRIDSPIATRLRHTLMHNHRYIAYPSMVGFADLLARSPAQAAADDTVKLEDALRLPANTSDAKARVQAALNSLCQSEFYQTVAEAERGPQSARVFIECIAYCLNDLASIRIKGGVSLDYLPDKRMAIIGIMMCIGECVQQLDKMPRETADAALTAYRAGLKTSVAEDLKSFVRSAKKLRTQLGHTNPDAQFNVRALASYQQHAGAMHALVAEMLSANTAAPSVEGISLVTNRL